MSIFSWHKHNWETKLKRVAENSKGISTGYPGYVYLILDDHAEYQAEKICMGCGKKEFSHKYVIPIKTAETHLALINEHYNKLNCRG